MYVSLIVNADDFGSSEKINSGILKAIDCGAVNSVSVIANGDAYAEAVRALRQRPQISVGWHVNLTRGRPLAAAALRSALVNRHGLLRGKWGFITVSALGRLDGQELDAELAAQWMKLSASGLKLTHVDGHHDIHFWPPVARRVAALLEGHPSMRVRYAGSKLQSAAAGRHWMMGAARLWQRKTAGLYGALRGADHVWALDLLRASDKSEALDRILGSLKQGCNEIVCHPGYTDSSDSGPEQQVCYRGREAELEALCGYPWKSLKKIRPVSPVKDGPLI